MIDSITGSGTVQAATYNYAVNRAKSTNPSENVTVGQTDKVSISAEAYAYSRSGEADDIAGKDVPGGNNLLDISDDIMEHMTYMLNNLEKITQEFKADLKHGLKSAGIDMGTEFKLTTGRDGSVRVVGDHPDKEAIEQYFEDNPDMRDRFVDIQVHTEIKEAIEAHTEFAEAYEKDPEAAVAKYFYLFDDKDREPFIMSIGGEDESENQAA
ncbi:hypothetical protein [Dethiosulfatarculus sandiegensis]|uniref:Uncharacterized protein n=1 Tax=Dethiosulfatarculus sandiegensis TaxID=1429043 RepID=A0A0D2J937_9BACT|nr:hypothetical protein [Dethiosulfatarculus sandiegensis]KIX14679.1 hypothetical protein X474_08515 [Dethiosulfatarculus sandiegensis]